MRYATMGLALLLGACAARQEGPATRALAAYNACLDARGVEGCHTEKAKLDAALAYANAESRRIQALNTGDAVPPVIQPYRLPTSGTRQPVTCTTIGNTMTCD